MIRNTSNIIYPLQTSFTDYPDDESEAVMVYMMGCRNECTQCHNPNFKNHKYTTGTKIFTPEELLEEIEKKAKRIDSNKVVLTGGDPVSSYNENFTRLLVKLGKNKFDFMIYTGHDYTTPMKCGIDGFKFIKCGRFKEIDKQTPEKTNEYIKFTSKNQRLYDENYRCISVNGIYYFKK